MSATVAPSPSVSALSRPKPMPLSTLAAKYWMAITGFMLVGFVVVHMVGNLQLFAGPDKLNAYARMLKDLGPLLWIARGGLLLVFLVHIRLAFMLSARNRAARPVRYQAERTLAASAPSRFMLLTGLVVLAFVIFHLAHYTLGLVHQVEVKESGKPEARQVSLLDLRDAKGRHDVYGMVILEFREWPIVVAYVVAQLLLAVHLFHGGSSMFQSLGLNHPRYNPYLRKVGLFLAVLIAAGNIAMPLAVFFRLIGADYQPQV